MDTNKAILKSITGISAENIIMYSTSWCGDCARARRFFEANKLKYTDIDIDEQPEYIELVRKLNRGNETVPTIIYKDKVLSDPTWEELNMAFLGTVPNPIVF